MKKHHLILAAVVVVAAGGAAWSLGWLETNNYSDDPEVARLEKMRDDAIEENDGDLRQVRGELREAVEGLTPEQRTNFFMSSMPIIIRMGAAQMETRLDEFLAMAPEEQQRELDKRIDEQLAREKERQQGKEGKGEARGRRHGWGQMTQEKRDEFRKKMQDWTTPEQRAKFETVMTMYNDRRQERGLDPVKWGRWH